MKLILLASRIFGVLVLDELLKTKDLVEVVAVVPGDDQVTEFAQGKTRILRTDNINSEPFLSQVRELQTELLINVFFLQKYRSSLLEIPRFGALNVHPSMLPSYRGRDCIRWAMINGEKEIGVTVHQMDEALDTGEIYLQQSVPVGPNDTYLDVVEKIKPIYPKIVLEAVSKLSRGELVGRKQKLTEEGTYFWHRTPEDGRIDWSDSSLDIYNLIRASNEPGFYAYTFLAQKKMCVTRARLRPGSDYESMLHGRSQREGRVLDYDYSDGSSVIVGTGDGVIRIERCCFEGEQEKNARDILKRGVKLT